VVVIVPMYWLEDFVARHAPPEFSHPELYYGFLGVTLAWQLVYLMIGWDPTRYRPVMPLAAFAKGSFAATSLVLYLGGRVPLLIVFAILPDAVFAVLFLYAFWASRRTWRD
jgi:hypothetical protein